MTYKVKINKIQGQLEEDAKLNSFPSLKNIIFSDLEPYFFQVVNICEFHSKPFFLPGPKARREFCRRN